jgi:hypothetical protein
MRLCSVSLCTLPVLNIDSTLLHTFSAVARAYEVGNWPGPHHYGDSRWELRGVHAISDRGEIAGTEKFRGESHAFLLKPLCHDESWCEFRNVPQKSIQP